MEVSTRGLLTHIHSSKVLKRPASNRPACWQVRKTLITHHHYNESTYENRIGEVKRSEQESELCAALQDLDVQPKY